MKSMDIYKKIIKNRETRMKILKYLSFIPDKRMIQLQYFIKLHRLPNLKEPIRYTEKIQWYKLNYRDPLMTQCADKYAVRDYVKSKGLDYLLNTVYGVYEEADEIEFDKLPESFVIKINNGSGTNILVENKKTLDIALTKKILNEWIIRGNIPAGREWCYQNISTKILIEKMLVDEGNPFSGINDWKFMCFNGKIKFIVLDVDRHCDHKRNFYTSDGDYVDIYSDHPNFGDCVKFPPNFNEMKRIAEIFAKDFPLVRVDLYSINNKIYFGELTFYPWSGYVKFSSDEFDFILGNKFELPLEQNKSKSNYIK